MMFETKNAEIYDKIGNIAIVLDINDLMIDNKDVNNNNDLIESNSGVNTLNIESKYINYFKCKGMKNYGTIAIKKC